MRFFRFPGVGSKSNTRAEPSLRKLISTFTRRDDIAQLLPAGGIGVELGVATGRFSEKLLTRSKLSHLYSLIAGQVIGAMTMRSTREPSDA
jgi:hypothetical protein